MPFAKCPTCSAEFHLNVLDIEEWYRENFPGVSVGEVVPAECPGCWTELRPGHRVRVRVVPAACDVVVEVGDVGTVEETRGKDPDIRIKVRLPSVETPITFRRADLSWIPG